MNHFIHVLNMPDGWLWCFPQFHGIILVLVLVAITFDVFAALRGRRIEAKQDRILSYLTPTECPSCHRKTLETIQRCTSPDCRAIRILKDGG